MVCILSPLYFTFYSICSVCVSSIELNWIQFGCNTFIFFFSLSVCDRNDMKKKQRTLLLVLFFLVAACALLLLRCIHPNTSFVCCCWQRIVRCRWIVSYIILILRYKLFILLHIFFFVHMCIEWETVNKTDWEAINSNCLVVQKIRATITQKKTPLSTTHRHTGVWK